MAAGTVRLILEEAEAEVVEAALRLYLMSRPNAHDGRYDYAYRIAQGVIDSLRRDPGELPLDLAAGDDDDVARSGNTVVRRYEGLDD